MVIIGLLYIILLAIIIGVIREEKEKRIEKKVIEGTMVMQLVIIGQWGVMGGEGVEGIEGYRWLGGLLGEIGEIIIGVDGISIWLIMLTG